jgi:long-subunit fatty acid transport protein
MSSVWAESLSSAVGGISSTPTRVSPAGVFWNPALIGFSSGTQLETNLTMHGGWLIYDRDKIDPNTGNPYASSELSALAPNPFIAINSQLGTKNFRFGYATYFPSGSMASYDPAGSQRFVLIEGLMIPWHHQVTVAYRPSPEWSIAISGIYSMGFFKTNLAIDMESLLANITKSENLPKEHPALTGRARIPLATTSAAGGALGVYYSPNYQWSFGLAVYSPIEYTFNTQLFVDPPKSISTLSTSLRALGIEDSIENSGESKAALPPYIQGGLSFQPYGYYTLEVFGRYSFSSLYSSISFEKKNSPIAILKDYSRPGLPLENTFLIGMVNSFSLWQRWTLGFNTTYSSNGVNDNVMSASLADFDSLLVGLFAQYQLSQDLKLGMEYAHSFMFDRRAQGTEAFAAGSGPFFLPSSSDGIYRAAADRLGLMVKYAF